MLSTTSGSSRGGGRGAALGRHAGPRGGMAAGAAAVGHVHHAAVRGQGSGAVPAGHGAGVPAGSVHVRRLRGEVDPRGLHYMEHSAGGAFFWRHFRLRDVWADMLRTFCRGDAVRVEDLQHRDQRARQQTNTDKGSMGAVTTYRITTYRLLTD